MKHTTKINEDNWNGFHGMKMSAGINEAPTYTDVDAPVGVNILHHTSRPGGYVTPSAANNTFHFDFFSHNSKVTNTVTNVAGGSGGGAGSAGVAWFGAHMKEIAIVAASAAVLMALVKLIKAANKSLKVRYNKVVKSLQQAQTDFVTNPMGLDMKNVLPGQGSKVYDWMARLFTLNLFGKKRREATRTNNIGLYPFCDRYKDEVAKDFKCAVEAFNKIKVAADEEKENGGVAQEGLQEGVYSSFHEAIASDMLNEGEEMNESVLAAISAGVGLASLAVRGGQFIISKIKDGKPVEDTEKRVQVTKESTREICYSIVYNYLDKYVNMDRVFKEMGITSNSLADLDQSSCEKFKMFLEKYQKPEKNNYTKQYDRLKTAYDNMLKHYYAIGDGIIKNFEKYTEAKDEKHANLLVAGKEKLQAMWDAQKDMFNNNFSHILIEVVSSEPYIAYLNFILEKVMPVFKSGLAGDADYVLDVMPKKDQYYLIRQTQEQPWLDNGEANNGNVAVARVLGYNSEKQEIQFRLIGLVNGGYEVSSNGIAELDTDAKVDYSVYKDDDGKKKEVTLTYGKWLSMDPFLMDWKEDVDSDFYMRYNKDDDKIEEYLYAYGSKESNDESGRTEFNRIVFATYDGKKAEFRRVILIKLDNPITNEDLEKICTMKSDEAAKNMDFSKVDGNYAFGIINRVNSLKKEDVDAKGTDDIIKAVNEVSEKIRIKAASALYKRTTQTERGRNIDGYLFAEVSGDLESVYTEDGSQRLNDTVNEADEIDSSMNVVNPGDKGADKPLIARIYCANVEAGKELTGDRKDNKFSGSIIKIDPACSVDDLAKAMEGMTPKFEKVENNEDALRKAVVDGILENKGSREVTLSQAYSIDKVGEAVSAIENRENAAEQMDNSTKDIANKIVEEVKKLALNPENDFTTTTLQLRSGKILRKATGVKKEKLAKGFVTVNTGIKSQDGNDIEIDAYPVLMKSKEGKEVKKTIGAILVINDYNKIVDFTDSPEEMQKGVMELFKEYKEKKHLEDSRWSEVEAAAEETPSEENKTPTTQIDPKVKESYDKAFNGVTFSDGKCSKNSGNYKDDNISVVFKGDKNLDIAFKGSDGTWYVSEGTVGDDNMFTIADSTGNKTLKVNPFDAGAVRAAVLTLNGKDPNQKQEENNPTEQKPEEQKPQESVSIKYVSADVVSEGLGKSVMITREYSKYMPKWYVLSESVYDCGNGRHTMLDSLSVRRKMNTRSDVMNYVKNSDSARIMVFESKHTYSISDVHGNAPSVSTPLYESVMFVKFDNEDNVVEKLYLGNNKIA